MKKSKRPLLGFTGSLILFGWGLYRLSNVSFSSYEWAIPFVLLITGGIGTIVNLAIVIRSRFT